MTQSYYYPLTAFVTSGGIYDAARLRDEINAAQSGVEVQLYALPTTTLIGGVPNCQITFKQGLADRAPLDAIVAAHSGEPLFKDPLQTQDGVILTQPQIQSFNWQLCDRDIKLLTCTMDPVAAVEDLKVNLATLREEPWDEAELVGVFKDAGAGPLVPCVDQTDADANGILTVMSYRALNQNTAPKVEIAWEIRDGGLVVDQTIPEAERYAHRLYAVAAPGLAAFGGAVRFFDGYMRAQPDGRVVSASPQAKRLDPEIPGANYVYFYVYHPAGAKFSHLVRVVHYRELGTV